MNATIRQNADNAQQTEGIALKSATDASESGEAVLKSVSAAPPKIGTSLKTEFIKGMGRQGDQFIVILDIDEVFSSAIFSRSGKRRRRRDMKHILVVSDDVQSAQEINHLLSGAGRRVISESDVPSALNRLTSGRPVDVVIIDSRAWSVKVNNTLLYARLAAPGVPVIVMTDWCSMDQYTQTMSLGAYEYFMKPLSENDLIRAVNGAVNVATASVKDGSRAAA